MDASEWLDELIDDAGQGVCSTCLRRSVPVVTKPYRDKQIYRVNERCGCGGSGHQVMIPASVELTDDIIINKGIQLIVNDY